MLNIAVCDDMIVFTTMVEEELNKVSKKYGYNISVDVFFSGKSLVDYIKKEHKYDLIYLDIEMKGKDGMEIAKEIRIFDSKVLIIYVTCHESFAKEAFEVSAFRFLTKPIDLNLFEKYFINAIDIINTKLEYFEYKYNKIHYKIKLNEIMYFQSDKRITYITTQNDIFKCYIRLNDIEEKLKKSEIFFLRTHQSFLVNPEFISAYMYDAVQLIDGTTISISIKKRKEVNKLYCRYKGDYVID